MYSLIIRTKNLDYAALPDTANAIRSLKRITLRCSLFAIKFPPEVLLSAQINIPPLYLNATVVVPRETGTF